MDEEGFVDFLPSGEAKMFEDQLADITAAHSAIVEMGTISMETVINLEARLPGVLTDHYPSNGYDQPLTPFEMRITLEQLHGPARFALAGFIGIMVAMITKLIFNSLSKTDGNTRHPALKDALARQNKLLSEYAARASRVDITGVSFSTLKQEVLSKLSDVQTAFSHILPTPMTIEAIWKAIQQPEAKLKGQIQDLATYKYSITKHIFNNFMAKSDFIHELNEIKGIIIASKEALPTLIDSHNALSGWANALDDTSSANAALPEDIGKSMIAALGVHGKDKTRVGEAVKAFTAYCKEGFAPHLQEGEAVPATVYDSVFNEGNAAKSDELTAGIVTEIKAVLDVLDKHSTEITNGWKSLQDKLNQNAAAAGQKPEAIAQVNAALALIRDVLAATGGMVTDLKSINTAVEAHRGARTEVINGQSKVFAAISAVLDAYTNSTKPEATK